MVQMNRFAGQKLRHRHREQTYGQKGGKAVGGWDGGVMNWAIGIDMYTLMCIKWMTNTKKQTKNPTKITYSKSHNIAHFKYVQFIVCWLYHNKTRKT